MKAIKILAGAAIIGIYLTMTILIIWFNIESPKNFGVQIAISGWIGFFTNSLLRWWNKFWKDK